MKFTRDGLFTAILVVAALFVGSLVTSNLPQPDALLTDRPFLHAVTVGETANLRTGDVTITDVQAAKRVKLFGRIAESAAVWIVVDLEWEPVRQPGMIAASNPVVVAADGRVFGGSQAVTNNCGPTQPRMAVACQLAYEVSIDALEGARLRVPAGSSVTTSDDVADVDLGIDASTAAAFAQTDSQIDLLETTAVTR
ncbi:MAG: hypothetical protein L0G23_02560 [Ruaniaceae bacterium]|nr:hypothetical protein [Ruaniaceae bacterium]